MQAAFTILIVGVHLLAGLILAHVSAHAAAAGLSTSNATLEQGISWPIVPGHALLIGQDHQRLMKTNNATHNASTFPTGRRQLEAQMTITNAAFLTGKHLRFYVGVGVGNRAAFMSHLTLDINAGFTWLQCRPCYPCYDQVDPIFHITGEDSDSLQRVASTSPLCQHVPGRLDVPPDSDCLYHNILDQLDGSYTMGILVADDFWMIGHASIPVQVGRSVLFGCSTSNRVPFTGPAGVLALGLNHPYAFQNQLQASLNLPDNTFSYCLSYEKSSSFGLLTFGGPVPVGTIFTPLVTNPNPNLRHVYYVTLLGISMGDFLLPIPPYTFDINPDTGMGGVVLATAEAETSLPEVAYIALEQAVVAALIHIPEGRRKLELAKSAGVAEFDLCFRPIYGSRQRIVRFYQISRLFEGIPPIVFHFAGGASLEIPWRNIVVPLNRNLEKEDVAHSSERERRLCMLVTRFEAPFLPTILGNHLQIGTRVTIDTQNQVVGFTPRHCDT
ncbi:hypothetical protein L7F22_013312 [Adiantum nelumboides]|nr:hypothetical protein [Adiantum nelumboides]